MAEISQNYLRSSQSEIKLKLLIWIELLLKIKQLGTGPYNYNYNSPHVIEKKNRPCVIANVMLLVLRNDAV